MDKGKAAPKTATGKLPSGVRKLHGETLKVDIFEEDVAMTKSDGDKVSSNAMNVPEGIRYVLTIYRNEAPYRSVAFPSQPTDKRVAHRVAAEVRYTLDEIPIREHSTGRSWDLAFRGMVGFNTRPSSRYDGSVASLSGIEALLQFDSFILMYTRLAEQEGSLYLGAGTHRPMLDRTFLVFYDLDEGLAYRVEPVSWDWDRGGRTRVGNAEWSLALHGYAPMENSKHTWKRGNTRRGKRQPTRAESQGQQYVSDQEDLLARLTRDSSNNQIAVASRLLDTATLADETSMRLDRILAMSLPAMASNPKQYALLHTVIDAANALTTKAQSLSALGADVRAGYYSSVGRQALIATVRAAESFVSAANTFLSAGQEIVNDVDGSVGRLFMAMQTAETLARDIYGALADVHAQLQDVLEDAVLGALPNFGRFPNIANQPSVVEQSSPSANSYTAQPGDTWQSIALWYYSNPDIWQVLAAFNGASSAYSSGGSAPLIPGTIIYMPSAGRQNSDAPGTADPEALFGVDFFVDLSTGDLMLDDEETLEYINGAYVSTPSPGRDVRLVRGRDNLVHSLSHQLLTVRGEVAAVPEYGVLPMGPGDPLTAESYASVIVGVVQGLQQDVRVKDVVQVRPSVEADKVSLSVQIVPASGATLGVVVPIGG